MKILRRKKYPFVISAKPCWIRSAKTWIASYDMNFTQFMLQTMRIVRVPDDYEIFLFQLSNDLLESPPIIVQVKVINRIVCLIY